MFKEFLPIIILILVISSVTGLNVWTSRVVIKKAVQKFIIPDLESKNRILIRYQHLGLLDRGDYIEDNNRGSIIAFGNGNPFISYYVKIYFQQEGENRQATVKINTFM